MSRRVSLAVLVLFSAGPVGAQELRLTLGQSVVNAIKNHPDLRVSAAAIMAAEAAVSAATAGYYPTISGSVSTTLSAASSSVAAGGQTVIVSGQNRNYSLGANLNQTLFDFGKTHDSVQYAKKNLESTEEAAEGTLLDTLLNVTTNYFTTLLQQQAIEIGEDNVRNARLQLGRAQGFYEIGTRAKIEVTQAEASLATAQLGLVQAQGAHSRARVALGSSMGEKQATEAPLFDTVIAEPPWTVDESVDLAMRYRPDIKAQVSVVEANRYNWQLARAQYLPSLSASAGYGRSDTVFPPVPYNWNIGATLSFPILNEPALSAAVASAQAIFLESEAQLESLSLGDRSVVASAWYDLNEAKASYVSAKSALTANEENYRLAAERYAVGVGTSLDVSAAQQTLTTARSQEVEARYGIQIDIAKLYRQVGVLNLELLLGAKPVPSVQDSPAIPQPIPKALKTPPAAGGVHP